MLKTASFIVKLNNPLYNYLSDICLNYTYLRNVSNYYIRQLYIGLNKESSKCFPNELEAIDLFKNSISDINKNNKEAHNLRINEIKKDKSLNRKQKKDKLSKLKDPTEYKMPTKENSFPGYYVLDAVLRNSKNENYYNLPSQVNQQAVKDTVESWVSFFKAIKEYKNNPSKFTGRPKIPKYIKGRTTTATFTNQICILKFDEDNNKYYLKFPKTKESLYLGNYYSGNEKLVEVKAKQVSDYIEVFITVDSEAADSKGKKLTKKELKERDDNKSKNIKNKEPKRVISIDIGLKNIAAISNNVGLSPMLIKGSVLVKKNKYYLKKISKAQTELRRGLDPNDNSKPHTSRKIKRLYAKRNRFLNDYFHKIVKFIVTYCIDNKIDTIIVGKNPLMKQGLELGDSTQDFAYIPFAKLFSMLQIKAYENDIKYIENNESYTSKSSFFDNDFIPNYGDELKENSIDGTESLRYKFSGKRITRDLYQTSNGYVINADINGSLNIIRKYDSNLTKDIKIQDVSRIQIINFRTFYRNY